MDLYIHRLLLLWMLLTGPVLTAQIYDDYLGAGHYQDITITTSHDQGMAQGSQTMSGAGMMPNTREASRFLAQATLGADANLIQEVAGMGISAWLDEQFGMEPTLLSDYYPVMMDQIRDDYLAQGGNPGDFYEFAVYFRYAWWQTAMEAEDVLRQRVALALSEIFVVSEESDLYDHGEALTSYYDMLLESAFENFRYLLYNVTMHPSMGFYLSHLRNPKANPDENIYPDENYAREVMQLFTIGLYELHLDGTPKTDNQGNYISTYTNYEIREFAKVFTGLGNGAADGQFWDGIYNENFDFWVPMKMYNNWHQAGSKALLNGFVIPGGQSALQDVQDAVLNLHNHPNVGPFIGKQLIQRLVKSNPTPAYVERVARAFNDNGEGKRGDMKAVVRAILTDPEARDCSWLDDPEHGKLREPIIRYTNLLRAFQAHNISDQYWNKAYFFKDLTRQHPLSAPSVFNFYLPNYSPNGVLKNAGLSGPEFQIHNAPSAVGFVNLADRWLFHQELMQNTGTDSWDWFGGDLNIPIEDRVILDLSHELSIATDVDALIDRLDIILTHGNLSDGTRDIIREALLPFDNQLDRRVAMALYLFVISPDYSVLR
ncbi:MAG: DUF1800 domain-containing protein [Phaeodactylibacter sp.]|nr:DUF1800 domain-containing protein [Phaeodactylibacter sp.]